MCVSIKGGNFVPRGGRGGGYAHVPGVVHDGEVFVGVEIFLVPVGVDNQPQTCQQTKQQQQQR